ncbi:hypothetical protein SCLCIDRAFT_78527, partial [Scleroderma citrinum Foug A]
VEKPKGSPGDPDFSLINVMELQDDKLSYLAIQVCNEHTVRDLCHAARLDWNRTYHEQPTRDLCNLFDVAKKEHPYLAWFHNNWATGELVKQYLRNRRKHMK